MKESSVKCHENQTDRLKGMVFQTLPENELPLLSKEPPS